MNCIHIDEIHSEHIMWIRGFAYAMLFWIWGLNNTIPTHGVEFEELCRELMTILWYNLSTLYIDIRKMIIVYYKDIIFEIYKHCLIRIIHQSIYVFTSLWMNRTSSTNVLICSSYFEGGSEFEITSLTRNIIMKLNKGFLCKSEHYERILYLVV